MLKTIIDAGPLIALFDKDDHYHEKTIALLKNIRGQLLSSWPVVTEAAHVLDFDVRAQVALFRWIERGGLRLVPLSEMHLQRVIELTEKYVDVPMDLADASLMVIAEQERVNRVITIDRDFQIYRKNGGEWLENVLG